MPDINPALLALIGTIFGGVGLKIVEGFLNKSKVKADIAADIRAELRADVAALREEVRSLTDELDKWKAKYYVLLDQFYRKGLDLGDDDPEGEPGS
jgi:hypothetical protein